MRNEIPEEPTRRGSQTSASLCLDGPTENMNRIPFLFYVRYFQANQRAADHIEILLASDRTALHDFMALCYGPARALA